MNYKATAILLVGVAGVVLGLWLGHGLQAHPAETPRIFELRTYTAHEGKLEELHARFRNHTTRLFERHGMTNIGYWVPVEAPNSQDTLIYLLAYPDRESARRSWEGFLGDADWQSAKAASEIGGPLVKRIDSVFLTTADYSAIR